MLEALQQRLEKYKLAAAQAKASGDDRKGRMHERIAKVKCKCSKLFASSKAVGGNSLVEEFFRISHLCIVLLFGKNFSVKALKPSV